MTGTENTLRVTLVGPWGGADAQLALGVEEDDLPSCLIHVEHGGPLRGALLDGRDSVLGTPCRALTVATERVVHALVAVPLVHSRRLPRHHVPRAQPRHRRHVFVAVAGAQVRSDATHPRAMCTARQGGVAAHVHVRWAAPRPPAVAAAAEAAGLLVAAADAVAHGNVVHESRAGGELGVHRVVAGAPLVAAAHPYVLHACTVHVHVRISVGWRAPVAQEPAQVGHRPRAAAVRDAHEDAAAHGNEYGGEPKALRPEHRRRAARDGCHRTKRLVQRWRAATGAPRLALFL
mmetsp:Transcript_25033/g.62580  ORF Transcript_25033/g.62580 Transcript_25033/m.62580 type:complete len:290 (-) Transcript_25033:494-1363(-)